MEQALNRARHQHSPYQNFTKCGKIHYFHHCSCSMASFQPNKQMKCTFLLANNNSCDRKILFLKFTAVATQMRKEAPQCLSSCNITTPLEQYTATLSTLVMLLPSGNRQPCLPLPISYWFVWPHSYKQKTAHVRLISFILCWHSPRLRNVCKTWDVKWKRREWRDWK